MKTRTLTEAEQNTLFTLLTIHVADCLRLSRQHGANATVLERSAMEAQILAVEIEGAFSVTLNDAPAPEDTGIEWSKS